MVCSQLEHVRNGVEREWAELVRETRQGRPEVSRQLAPPTQKLLVLDGAAVVQAVEEFRAFSDPGAQ